MKFKKNIINKLRNNKDARTLTENFISLSLLQVAGYIFPFLTIPYLARVIGVDKFGEIALAAAIIVYFQTVIDWGFNFTATRDIAKNKENIIKISKIFSNVIWTRFFLTVLSAIVLSLMIIFIPVINEMKLLLILTFCLIPGKILFPDWLFQGLEKMKYITILNLISKLIFTIAIFVFIKEKSDYVLQPLLLACGYMISGIISMYIILIKWKIKLYRPSIKYILSTIKSGTDIFINQLMPNLYNSFSILLLGFFGGAVATGKLEGGNKFANIAIQMLSVISRTFFPYLSRKINKHSLYAKINIYISVLISTILFVFAPLFVDIILTPEFKDSGLVLRILSISIIFITLNSVFGTNYLIVQGHEKILRNITIISSLIGFLIAVPFVYYFNFLGAALTICITRGILGLLITYKALKIKKHEKKSDNSWRR